MELGPRPRAQHQPARRRQVEIKRNSGLPEPGKSEMSLGGETSLTFHILMPCLCLICELWGVLLGIHSNGGTRRRPSVNYTEI